jgi:hypothetical protein
MMTSYYLKILFLVVISFVITTCRGKPLGKSRLRATHVNPEGDKWSLSRLFVWPNTFYDRPRHRYPYYDENGTGRLLYGYGGSNLYRYSVFKPLEGYFK